ncbi:MAG: hypothetical protein ACKVWR_18285 [Acidimicrobiales bacterium]
MSALLAGAVLGFFIDPFSALDRELVLVGAPLIAYLLARSTGRAWLPPMLPALVATVTPVVVLLMTLPTNIPSMVLLENNGYQPPKGMIGTVSGLSTIASSLLGPSATSLSLPGTAICLAPDSAIW